MLVVLAVALIVASVWGIVFYRQVGLLGGCLAVLLVGSCLGHPFYHVNAGPIPITADRLLLGVVLADLPVLSASAASRAGSQSIESTCS